MIIIKKCFIQLKRELWENKKGFLWTPAVVTLLLTLFTLYGVSNYQTMIHVKGSHWSFGVENHNSKAERLPSITATLNPIDRKKKEAIDLATDPRVVEEAIPAGIVTFCGIIFIPFSIVLFVYAHDTLFDDRKNREILFWRSMPVSETMNILIKLFMILFIAPTIMISLSFLSGFLVLVVSLIIFSATGALPVSDVAPFLPVFKSLFFLVELYGMALFSLTILLPLIGWIFFSSALAKKSPFLISTLVPVALIIIDKRFQRHADINFHIIDTLEAYEKMASHFLSWFSQYPDLPLDAHVVTHYLLALLIGGLLITATIWLRNHRYEI